MQDDFYELSFENGIKYKMYLPFKDSDYIQKTIFHTKAPYEIEMLKDMITRIKPNSNILDIGMNIANHSLFLAAHNFKIFAFEANKKMIDIARKSIEINGFEDRIFIYEMGVSDKEERAYYKKENPYNFGGMSLTLLNEEETKDDYIQCKSIDSLNIQDEISLIKLDIEGMEDKALRGLKALILKNRPLIYVEANYVGDLIKVDRILSSFNYIHMDIFGSSPTHLYYPIEKLSQNELFKNISYKQALTRLDYTHYKQNNFIHNNLQNILNLDRKLEKEILDIKKEFLKLLNKDKEIKELKNTIARHKKMLCFRWGKSLLSAIKNPFKFIILPFILINDYKKFKRDLKKD
ncbi:MULTISPECIES: FkbM family methyltransferase [unclassified Campylobacter]|uniref:FkbM family methyltransferase n=1 Tax=unclassified Campylobacter TaxID=2593542 RepID=UPI00123805AF|nr:MULTISPECIES: FkbM family methyltransferase [unclassified Campylobacter]KAA6228673.1 FkbM family methyltransferase [Campylobacter sp. LR185c]KAA6229076.1 FkbM family methyltransferase [Campylobacter sp. LR286c]KAA6230168.1 FkbM family methyltransferase [Campylobacter sp. LR291e]KAA8604298.1 hypothetical protein CGP82_03690 [Campylobacter sp. LR185c]